MTKNKPQGITLLLKLVGWILVGISVAAGIYFFVAPSMGGGGVSIAEWCLAAGGLVSGLILLALAALIDGLRGG